MVEQEDSMRGKVINLVDHSNGQEFSDSSYDDMSLEQLNFSSHI
jgi:hypothetical protein